MNTHEKDEVLLQNQNQEANAPHLFSQEGQKDLVKLKKYMNIMAIFYYVVAWLNVLGSVISLYDKLRNSGNHWGMPDEPSNPIYLFLGILLQLAIAAFWFFLGSYLRDAVKSLSMFNKTREVSCLELSLKYQSGYWKMLTFFVITIVGILLLAMLIFVFSGIIDKLG